MCAHVRVRRCRLHPNAQPRRYPRSVYKHHVISAKDRPELGVVLTLSFGSFPLYGRKFTNAPYRGPERHAVARRRGFGVYNTDPLCYRRSFFVQRALLVGFGAPRGGGGGVVVVVGGHGWSILPQIGRWWVRGRLVVAMGHTSACGVVVVSV